VGRAMLNSAGDAKEESSFGSLDVSFLITDR
jgi:hypothetical protein